MFARTSCLLTLAFASLASADEGMWLFTNPPRELLKEKHGFELTDKWLEHVQKSSVRFESGGSASFVSADGLIITNHHVGSEAIAKLSSKEHDYLRDGFMAKTLADEKKCLDEEANVLQSIEDVTARVNAAVPKDASAQDAFLARRKVIAEIEKESEDKTGLHSQVVTLYQGGQYHLYRFKRYSDLRLVFAPEQQAAFFGGDPDNFEFPRFNLDISVFRAYENDKPVKVEHFLKFNPAGPKEDELTFVSGHPGRTDRLMTVSQLEFLRDVNFPWLLSYLKRLEVLLGSWAERGEENARRAKDDLFGIKNSRKARDGGHAGLMDPALMGRKAKAEGEFKAKLAGKPEFAEALAAYGKIEEAGEVFRKNFVRYRVLERSPAFGANLFGIARELLRAGDEFPKPNGDRLQEFGEAGKKTLERELLSEKPIYDDYEWLRLADGLMFLAEQLGMSDPLVKQVLAGKSPRERATELLAGTKVKDVAFRKQLYQGGAKAVQDAADPLIELARLVDTESRAVRKIWEEKEETVKQAHAAIAKARFALEGTSTYPDATFTLRLAYGPVKSYQEGGKTVPAITTMGGKFQRGADMKYREPFDIPQRWLDKKSAINLATPYNFVSTADIIGGNSGSPVINRAGEWVGIIFDGNIQSLVLDFAYDDSQARAISVHSASVMEGLKQVYEMTSLAEELIAGHR